MSYTVLDLFSGAGGLTLGLDNAGLKTVAAIEIDRFAAETYNANFPDVKLFTKSIRDFSDEEIKKEFGGIDVITGGPPCQGFSVAGPSQYGIVDERNDLLLESIRFVKVLKPKVVVFENVKGILAGKIPGTNKKAIPVAVEKIEALGYDVRIYVLQAANYGVPQWRERVFIFCVQKGLKLPEFVSKFGENASRPWVTVGEALSDLPPILAGEGSKLQEYATPAQSEYQKAMRVNSKNVTNHVAMKHTPRLIERFKHIPVGGSLVHAPAEHGQRQRNGTAIDARKRFKMNNQRLDPNKISLCVTASFQSNYVHPSLHRNLTAREGARLQSIPDHFIFKGPRTLMSKTLLKKEGREDEIGLSQYNQIGNMVPPLLATAVGEKIIEAIESVQLAYSESLEEQTLLQYTQAAQAIPS